MSGNVKSLRDQLYDTAIEVSYPIAVIDELYDSIKPQLFQCAKQGLFNWVVTVNSNNPESLDRYRKMRHSHFINRCHSDSLSCEFGNGCVTITWD